MAGSKHPQIPQDAVMCARCRALYVQALGDGAVSRAAAASAQCLTDLGMLEPDGADPARMLPVPVATAFSLALARRRRQDVRQSATLVSDWPDWGHGAAGLSIVAVSGLDRINERLDEAMAQSETEVLTMQPKAALYTSEFTRLGAARDLVALRRGVAMRTLYVHAARFIADKMSYQQQLRQYPVQVRTLPGVVERMIVVDAKVAFIPANEDRTQALEIRHPPLVRVLRQCFELLWDLGVPLWEPVDYGATGHEVSAVQRAIARMLVEGQDDQAIAARLGVNVRTVRGHIAKLSAALGSHGRTQLGFLIARSGILGAAG